MLQKLPQNKLPYTLVLCLWIALSTSLCPDQAHAQNNGFSIRSDSVCNVDTGGFLLDAYEETISFGGVPRAQDSVTIKLLGEGDIDQGQVDEYLALRGEDSVYYDTLNNPSSVCRAGYDSVSVKVSASTFNQWLRDDDTVRFFLDPGKDVNSFCDCTSECDQSKKPNCGSSDVFYKAAIELTYPPLFTYQKTYGDSLVDEGLGVTRDGQGGAIVTGKTRSFGQGQ